ncbi:hypothetical protein Rsub_08894 [Raphidocelis subcapitata]|uniref:Uncharacterized protein n=1 Tax=Raphidocelis subcapitata TaxID=307507 RepID=A0A2V0P8H2_9CHLO|nr:hypothetical protein Rsub_08894 [Raphidocelis subcapitata]|eukprot:GBF96146.1 hypothetical protein Rsub_08894 [Raphidocelis subcapitata]
MESTVGTLSRRGQRTSHAALTASPPPAPAGLGAALVPSTPAPGRRRLLRQATLAKGQFVPAALPLFDVSIAVLQSLDEMRAAVGEDMVLASTLHVPAHHVLACKAEAYGTPFSAPALQALHAATSLAEDDKQFAACLAAPPDMEELQNPAEGLSVQHRLIRLASLAANLQTAPSLAAQPSAALSRSAPSTTGGDGKLQLVERTSSDRRRAAPGPGRQRSGADDGDAARALSGGGGHEWDPLEGKWQRQQHHHQQQGSHQPAAAAAGLETDGGAGAPLLASCGDAVAALVGVGALLARGFAARAAPARGLVEARVRALMGVRSLVVPLGEEGPPQPRFTLSSEQPRGAAHG